MDDGAVKKVGFVVRGITLKTFCASSTTATFSLKKSRGNLRYPFLPVGQIKSIVPDARVIYPAASLIPSHTHHCCIVKSSTYTRRSKHISTLLILRVVTEAIVRVAMPDDLSLLDQLEEWLESQVPHNIHDFPLRMLETMERMSNELSAYRVVPTSIPR